MLQSPLPGDKVWYNNKVTTRENTTDLQHIVITPDTDPALVPFIRAYQSHGIVPTRYDLIDAREDEVTEMYQLTGWCTLRGLSSQAGYDADDYIKQLREAEKMMARAMDDDA